MAVSRLLLSAVLAIALFPLSSFGVLAYAEEAGASVREDASETEIDPMVLSATDKGIGSSEQEGEEGEASEHESVTAPTSIDVEDLKEEATEAEVQVENSFRFETGKPVSVVEDAGGLQSRSMSARAGAGSYVSFGYGPCRGYDANKGIDVSHWQGSIDWNAVKLAGVNFAILKCASGKSVDSTFATNVTGCRRTGMKFGVYYYSYATSPAQGTVDAQRVISQLHNVGISDAELGYPIYYDLEDATVRGMSASEKAGLAWNFVVTLRNAGYSKIGIYSNMDWWCNQLTDPYFKSTDLYRWVAQYNSTGLGYHVNNIYANNPFSDFRARGDVWQFSSSGRVSGISGNVDLNYSYYNMIDSDEPGAMFRLYNPNSGEHFYTASTLEGNHLINVGWRYEGVSWIAPASSNSPVYRMYNPNAGDHHYTTSWMERDSLVRSGWRYEGVGWYSDDSQTTPLHRLYNPNAWAGAHHYTTSAYERDALVRSGWRAEGIGWYGM